MWHKMTPGERAKLLGLSVLSMGLTALAISLVYFTITLNSALQEIPAILAQVERTSAAINPVLQEVDKIQAQITPILNEVRLTREQIPPILNEVAAVRQQVPAILAEVAAVRADLPPLLQTTARTVQQASDSVVLINKQIPPILTEVRETREALPGLLDRADQLVANASNVGRKATQGAMTGVVGGLILAPFRLFGEAGKSMAHAMKLEPDSGFTPDDEQLATEATDAVIKSANIGEQHNWRNAKSGNSGSATLLAHEMRNDKPCFKVRQQVALRIGKNKTAELMFCQNADGTWVTAAD